MSIDRIIVDLDDAAREVAAELNDRGAQPIRGTWADIDDQVEEDDDVWELG
jgi:hypothetical protein